MQAGLQALEPFWRELEARVNALARRRQRYAEFFDFAPVAAAITDSRGNIVEVNQAMSALLGPRAALLGRKPLVALFERGSQRGFVENLLSGSSSWTSVLRTPRGPVEVLVCVRRVRAALCWSLKP